MAVTKSIGHGKRNERNLPVPGSLGPREPNTERNSSLTISALAAIRNQKGTNHQPSTSSKKKRGHTNKAQSRAKLERAVENADRLHAKASKRAHRDEKRKRAKEVLT